MHEIFTEMYSTVSTGTLCMESSTRFSQASLKCRFPIFHYRTRFFCCLSHFFSIRTLQTLSKRHTRFQYVLRNLLTHYFSASNRFPFLEIAPFFAALIFPHPHSQSPKIHAVSIDDPQPPLNEFSSHFTLELLVSVAFPFFLYKNPPNPI